MTSEDMAPVFFKATAKFTGPISKSFYRKLKRHQAPFTKLEILTCTDVGFVSGVLPLENPWAKKQDTLIYLIGKELVDKVELYSQVGIERLEFSEITPPMNPKKVQKALSHDQKLRSSKNARKT